MSILDARYENFSYRIDCKLDAATGNNTDIEIDIYKLTNKAINAAMSGRTRWFAPALNFGLGTLSTIDLADVLVEPE